MGGNGYAEPEGHEPDRHQYDDGQNHDVHDGTLRMRCGCKGVFTADVVRRDRTGKSGVPEQAVGSEAVHGGKAVT